jgi:hypothetical protein
MGKSIDGVAQRGKTDCKYPKASGDTIGGGGKTGGGWPLPPTTMPRDIKLPNGAKP